MPEIETTEENYECFAAKVHKQHNSLVCIIPKVLAGYLDIKPGDYVAFEKFTGEKTAKFRIMAKGVTYGIRGRRGRDRENQGG